MKKIVPASFLEYYFFARWFSHKTTRSDLKEYLLFLQENCSNMNEVFLNFKEVIQEWLDNETTALALPQEYTKLFHLPEGIKPYESVYLGEGNKLMQESWVAVKKFYTERGWYMEKSKHLEDHVSVELSFMAHLLAEKEYQDAQEFFSEHIITWVPRLMEDLASHGQAIYYKTVANFCRAFLEEEKKHYQKHT